MGRWKKLDKLPLAEGIDEDDYLKRLVRAQLRLLRVQQWLSRTNARAIVAIEGWDAAGKGGLIQRLTEKLDPRPVEVWRIAAPRPDEQGKHYLYRFWEKLPAPGTLAIFDRTWYGRVLVERIEGYAKKSEWQRAYGEINAFEKMLTDSGVKLIKILLNLSAAEQRERIMRRLETPEKRFKVTLEDFRNLGRRDEYVEAFDDMLERTDTDDAPWYVISSDSKKRSRVDGVELVADLLGKGADLEPPPVDPAVAEAARKVIGWDPDKVSPLASRADRT
ncbi:MAG: polyphosphate kinase [Alphaproteobacteria bacterium]|nr:polyphosphate kinase [Alphaproteobacteria bacterium]MCW5744389.1 polyphosphate kinase [Alphaproteobacteria bacterium]